MSMTWTARPRRKPKEKVNLLTFVVDTEDPKIEPFISRKRAPSDRRIIKVLRRPGKIKHVRHFAEPSCVVSPVSLSLNKRASGSGLPVGPYAVDIGLMHPKDQIVWR